MPESRSILILCGGTGPRLWPMSRASKPKQFLKIFNNESFLQQSVRRCLRILKKERIFLISNEKYIDEIKSDLGKMIPEENIIAEPIKKNTMMAISYGTSVIGSGTVASIHSDYYIEDEEAFARDIKKGFELAENTNFMVTVGIKPSWNNPAFGYIETQKVNKEYQKVAKFIEKPEAGRAEKLIKDGAWWNSGIYIFRYDVLEKELYACSREYAGLWEKLKEKNKRNLKKIYELAPAMAIDKIISEKSQNMVMIPARFDWSDVGEWGSIYNKLTVKKGQNALIGRDTMMVEEGSVGCLIKGETKRLIGLCGVKDLAIIDTQDALLVCDLADSYQVRKLITKIVADRKLAGYFLETYEEKG